MSTSIYSKTSTQSAIQVNGADSIVFDSTGILFGAPIGFRNKVINGNFVVNQRAVSGTVTLGANSYGHDRFKSGAGGCTYTFSASANGMILNITAGTLLQIIEGANLEGGSMKLSWFGTSAGRIDTGGYGASGVVGTAVAGINQTVEFGVGTLARVQYELGTVATTFEQRSLGLELSLCQRYYEILFGVLSSTTLFFPWTFKATKRVVSTYLALGATNGGTLSAGSTNGTYQDALSSGSIAVSFSASAEL